MHGVDNDDQHADIRGYVTGASQGVNQQHPTQPLPLVPLVHRQPSKQDGGEVWVAGKLGYEGRREVYGKDSSSAQGVVAVDRFADRVEEDEAACDVSPLVLPGSFSEIAIELFLAT